MGFGTGRGAPKLRPKRAAVSSTEFMPVPLPADRLAHTERYLIDVYRVGWPSVAFQWDSWIEWEALGVLSTSRFDGHPPFTAWHFGLKPPDFLISGPNNQWKRLPIRPATWLGLSTNTLFYAALLWLLISGPFTLRRFVRMRRGRCPKCAYPMGDSSVCTECGCELPKRARTTGEQ